MAITAADLDPKDPTQSLDIEDQYAKDLARLFDDLQKRLEEYISTGDVHLNATPAKKLPFDIAKFTKDYQKIVDETVLKPGEEITGKMATDALKHGASYSKLTMGMEAVLKKGDWDPNVLKILKARNLSELKGISDAVGQKITRIMTDGMLQGENPRVIARRLREATDLGKVRSEVLARTETMKAVNTGTVDRSEKQGYAHVERVETIDEKTCTDWEFDVDGKIYMGCAAINGEIFTMDQARQIIAQQHPNCRGGFIPAMTDEEAAAIDAEG